MSSASDTESSPPSSIPSPPRAKDPPEITVPTSLPLANHPPNPQPPVPADPTDSVLPPALPPATLGDDASQSQHDAPQTQEWTTSNSEDTKKKRTRVAYLHKGLSATQQLFLDSNEAAVSQEQDEVYLVGKVMAVPRKGVSDVFKILWDKSSLPSSMANAKLRHTIPRSNTHLVALLRIARCQFDAEYPDGRLPLSLNINSTVRSNKGKPSKKRARTTMATPGKKKARTATPQQNVPIDTSPQRRSRLITNLRMIQSVRHNMGEQEQNDDGRNQLVSDSDSDLEEEDLNVEFDNHPDIDLNEIADDRISDPGYNPQTMEEDGSYPNELSFKFEDLPPDGIDEDIYRYDGPGPCLRNHIANKFSSPLQACGVAGGFTYDLIKRITANSNAYAFKHRGRDNRFAGYPWTPISVEEMFHALGIILKMSINNRNIGGMETYFNPPQEMKYCPGRSIAIDGFSSWAADVMTFYRFRQIRAALHPESGRSLVGDKCHQLRATIESLNAHAIKTFIPGRECSFDEGGVTKKSRYNPVRQYNSSKPDAYRIDFFVLVNASQGLNFVYHIDVYQGKNANNAHIAEEAWNLPTTQKAVVNALVLSGLENDPDGMRELYMDNRYSSPNLFILLRERYKILACGTIRANRKGWDPKIMNLAKSSPRGTSLTKYDPINRILFGQWNDNKVVSFISTLGISGLVTIQRRVGPDIMDYQIEESLKRYTRDNFMGGVDNVDKDKKLGGSFTAKARFNRWYRMGLMGLFDFMVVNGRMAWNMSCTDNSCSQRRFVLSNSEFRCIVAHELLKFRDTRNSDLIAESSLIRNSSQTETSKTDHHPSVAPRGVRVRCCVCRLEDGLQNICRRTPEGRQQLKDVLGITSVYRIRTGSFQRKFVAACTSDECSLYAHCMSLQSDNLIFRFDEFKDMTCFEIAHSPEAKNLWSYNEKHKECLKKRAQHGRVNDETNEVGDAEISDEAVRLKIPRAFNVRTSHPLYIRLRDAYGLSPVSRVRTITGKTSGENDGEKDGENVEEQESGDHSDGDI